MHQNDLLFICCANMWLHCWHSTWALGRLFFVCLWIVGQLCGPIESEKYSIGMFWLWVPGHICVVPKNKQLLNSRVLHRIRFIILYFVCGLFILRFVRCCLGEPTDQCPRYRHVHAIIINWCSGRRSLTGFYWWRPAKKSLPATTVIAVVVVFFFSPVILYFLRWSCVHVKDGQ